MQQHFHELRRLDKLEVTVISVLFLVVTKRGRNDILMKCVDLSRMGRIATISVDRQHLCCFLSALTSFIKQ